jgi:hypothetical protein
VAVFCAASISLSTMCFGVAPSGLPMPKSMMSSPRLRAEAFNSPVMLNTYAGSRVSLLNSSIRLPPVLLQSYKSIETALACVRKINAHSVYATATPFPLRYFAVKTIFTGSVFGG